MLTINFTPYPELTTERLVLRRPLITDDKETFIMRTDEVANKYIDRPKTVTIQDAQNVLQRLNEYIDNNESIAWGINVKGETKLLGTVCLWNIDKEKEVADIGYELTTALHRKGIMSEALSRVLEYGFNEMNLQRIEGWVHKDNVASIKLLEKFGFVKDDHSDQRVAAVKEEHMVIYTLARKQ